MFQISIKIKYHTWDQIQYVLNKIKRFSDIKEISCKGARNITDMNLKMKVLLAMERAFISAISGTDPLLVTAAARAKGHRSWGSAIAQPQYPWKLYTYCMRPLLK